jgi:hypothetical protein
MTGVGKGGRYPDELRERARADGLWQSDRVARRRVTLRESYRKANGGPASNKTAYGYGELFTPLWHWIAGEPVEPDPGEASSDAGPQSSVDSADP